MKSNKNLGYTKGRFACF